MRSVFSHANNSAGADTAFEIECLETRRMYSVAAPMSHILSAQPVPTALHAKAASSAHPSLIRVGPGVPHQILYGFISGTVFNDTNNENGIQDAGEAGVAGRQVYLDIPGLGHYVAGDPTTITNAAGYYSFSGLAFTNYLVRLVQVDGSLIDSPVFAGDHYAQLSLQYSVINQNFGLVTAFAAPTAFQGSKLLVASRSYLPGSPVADIGIRRFNRDGTVDTTFGTNGYVNLINTQEGGFGNIVVLPNGNIVAVLGFAGGSGLYLLTPNGVVLKNVGLPADQVVYKVAVQSNSKLVLSTGSFNESDRSVIRLNADLTLDSTFGGTGTVHVPAAYGYTPTNLTVLSSGNIQASYMNSSNTSALLVTLNSSGVIL